MPFVITGRSDVSRNRRTLVATIVAPTGNAIDAPGGYRRYDGC